MGRKPKSYDGTETTSRSLKDIIPSVMSGLKKAYVSDFHSILAVWSDLVGPQIAKSTTPASFRDGILIVNVNNSTLYTLLRHYEKMRIIRKIQHQFPKSDLKDIVFRRI